jgi:hypothetical protein
MVLCCSSSPSRDVLAVHGHSCPPYERSSLQYFGNNAVYNAAAATSRAVFHLASELDGEKAVLCWHPGPEIHLTAAVIPTQMSHVTGSTVQAAPLR